MAIDHGWRAGSLALLADAFHNLGYVGGLLLAWQDADGRQRLYFENNRNDEIQVLIRARRVSGNQ